MYLDSDKLSSINNKRPEGAEHIFIYAFSLPTYSASSNREINLPVISEIRFCHVSYDQRVTISSGLTGVLFGGSQLSGVFKPKHL